MVLSAEAMGLTLVLPLEIQAGPLISLGQCKDPKTVVSCLWDCLAWTCCYSADICKISAGKGLVFNWIILLQRVLGIMQWLVLVERF